MKKKRNPGQDANDKVSASKSPGSPPLLSLEELDARVMSSTPSMEASWWISHQVTEHVFSSIARIDRRTGESLVQPLSELLQRLRDCTANGCRPFPHDRLFAAATYAEQSMAHLLEHHRHRLVRTHEQLPFHRLREMDTRSLAWLARQPGRNVREKLSGRTHALGVKRNLTADTTENRLLRSFAKLLAGRASRRLELAHVYDRAKADDERRIKLEEVMYLCDEGLRRSELAELPALGRIKPNNVLLVDPHYSRIFRAWKWLRDEEDALQQSWPEVMARVRTLLHWLVATRLSTFEQVFFSDTLGRVVLGRGDRPDVGVEMIAVHRGRAVWQDNHTLRFLVVPLGSNGRAFQVRLSLDKEFLLVHVAALEGRGVFCERSVFPIAFEIKIDRTQIALRRGLPMTVKGSRASLHGYADIEGLKMLAEQMARQILEQCAVRFFKTKADISMPPPMSDGVRLGFDFGSYALFVHDGQSRPVNAGTWCVALNLPGNDAHQEWIEGTKARQLAVGVRERFLWAMADVLDPVANADPGILSLVVRNAVQGLAEELAAPARACAAYAVPDAMDEFSQRTIRAAIGAAFPGAIPVWRSIAGAMGWVSSPAFQQNGAAKDDSIIVVDVEFSRATMTRLDARYDDRIARLFPTSRGIYCERKPPVPPDEQLEQLGWPNVLRGYAEWLVGQAGETVLDPEEQRSAVDDLLRLGYISQLVDRGGSVFVELAEGLRSKAKALQLVHDPKQFREMANRWLERLGFVLAQELREHVVNGKKLHVLLIGGPTALEGFAQAGIGKLWEKLRHFENIHLIAISPTQIAAGAHECLLRIDAKCIAWTEWLPDLSLEVVRDGHYGELTLLEPDKSVDPFFGTALEFPVHEMMTLARGHKWYSFPLLLGRKGRRPLAWEARLQSPAFPLDRDVRAKLRLSYHYGLDTSYRLTVEPESPASASFTTLEARWTQTRDSAEAVPAAPPLQFAIGQWDPMHVRNFIDATNALQRFERSAEFIYGRTRECWSEGRSAATAPLNVQAAWSNFLTQVVNMLSDEEYRGRALEILSLLHEDAPSGTTELVIRADRGAGDHWETYKKTAAMLAMLVGDGTGERAALLDRLLWRLQRHGAHETFNPGLVNVTMRAIANAMWRHPGLVYRVATFKGAAVQLIAQCRRTLQNLLIRVPTSIAAGDRERVKNVYAMPFRDTCEILLGLLRLDSGYPDIAELRCGSGSADTIAKTIRRLDARFTSARIDFRWRVHLTVNIPPALSRMSPVPFVLNGYLVDGAGVNLVHVDRADMD